MKVEVGMPVLLVTPDNPRLHGAPATVREVTPWGAHVATAAAATGQYRAWGDEMAPVVAQVPPPPREVGYTGNCCAICGSSSLVRNGPCELCVSCGATSGCS